MKKLLCLLLAATAFTPALAQHGGHGGHAPAPRARPQPQAQPSAPARTRQAAPRRRTQAPRARPRPQARPSLPARSPQAARPATGQQQQPNPHAGHGQPAQAQPGPHAGHGQAAPPQQDPHAGHGQAAEPRQDPHAGHDMGTAQPADPHAGHQMAETPPPPVGPPPPAALTGPEHAADALFGAGAVAAARDELRATHGGMPSHRLSIDQLELAIRDGRDGISWEDVQFWYGGDIDRLVIKSQGEATLGEGVETAEVQALWSHAIDPWFNLQAGLRYDFRPRPDRAYLVLGVQGLAPYWFEIDGALFLSEKGDLSARVEGEYDLRVTQRLILQPRVELDLALQDVPELRVGGGLSTVEAGLRLRYEFVPEFAPYVGVQYERAFGDTADFRRLAGEDVGGWSLVLGIKAWF